MPPSQTPLLHVLPTVQTVSSSQTAPSGRTVCTHVGLPPTAWHVAAMQVLASSGHATARPARQAPAAQLSLAVHGSPSASHAASWRAAPSWRQAAAPLSPTAQASSVQALPSSQFSGTCPQPAAAEQLSCVQGSLSSQFTGGPGHAPAAHASGPVQALSSVHVEPSARGTTRHLPVAGSHAAARQARPGGTHEMTDAGFSLQAGFAALSQYSVPLQGLPSSWPAQSASVQHAQVGLPGRQVAPRQASPVVQGLPSSQGAALVGLGRRTLRQLCIPGPAAHTVAVRASGVALHAPVLGSQAFFRHAVSAVVAHVIASPGLSAHWLVCALQNIEPAQRSCGCAAQSASVLQAQAAVLLSRVPAAHVPCLQRSPTVHGSPSWQPTTVAALASATKRQAFATPSHTARVRSVGVATHAPSAGRQAFLRHVVSWPAGQIVTVEGLGRHALLCWWQYRAPLQASASSPAAQSASLLQPQTKVPATQLPPPQVSALVQASPSSQATASACSPGARSRHLHLAPSQSWRSLSVMVGSQAPVLGRQARLMQGPSAAWEQTTGSVPARHAPVFASHVGGPAQRSPVPAQSASTLHPHAADLPGGSASPTQVPSVQRSLPVHGSPSSQAAPSGPAETAHLPVSGLQLAIVQVLSGAAHTVAVAGSGRQRQGKLSLAHTGVPAHLSTVGWPAQSTSLAQVHSDGPASHTPNAQRSPVVQGRPSSHGCCSCRGRATQLPDFGSQRVQRHHVSSVVSHVTAVAGATAQRQGIADVSQRIAPAQRSARRASQSASFRH